MSLSPPPPRRLRRLAVLGLTLVLIVSASVVVLVVDFHLKSQIGRHLLPSEEAAANIPQLDGQISEDEYAFHYYDVKIRMDLYWTIVGDTIYLGLKSPAHGWLAIGLAPTGPQMLGADILIGYVEDGQVHVRDDYADTPTSHTADTVLGGSNDILAAAGSESDQGTIIELERKLTTLDPYDRPIVPTDMPVELAYSNGKDFNSYHDQNRDTVFINFFTGKITQP
jgi:hypothetical protein